MSTKIKTPNGWKTVASNYAPLQEPIIGGVIDAVSGSIIPPWSTQPHLQFGHITLPKAGVYFLAVTVYIDVVDTGTFLPAVGISSPVLAVAGYGMTEKNLAIMCFINATTDNYTVPINVAASGVAQTISSLSAKIQAVKLN